MKNNDGAVGPLSGKNWEDLDVKGATDDLSKMKKEGRLSKSQFEKIVAFLPTLVDLSKQYAKLITNVVSAQSESDKRALDIIEGELAELSKNIDAVMADLAGDPSKLEVLKILLDHKQANLDRAETIHKRGTKFRERAIKYGGAAFVLIFAFAGSRRSNTS